MADPIGSFARSWRLIQESFDILRSDGELLILPAISGIATAILVAFFVWAVLASGSFDPNAPDNANLSASLYVWLFLFYVVQYFIIIFFNTALVGAALARLEGGDPTVSSAIALASQRIVPILGYAIVSATVGLVLRTFAERLGFLGRLIGLGLELAWTVATFLVVPVLAAEGLGPIAAVEKSSALLRTTWGENLVGSGGIAIILSVAAAVVAVLFGGGGALLVADNYVPLAIVVFAAGAVLFLTVLLFGAALTAIYSAAVYYFAVVGEPPRGFDRELIHSAFKTKPGKA